MPILHRGNSFIAPSDATVATTPGNVARRDDFLTARKTVLR